MYWDFKDFLLYSWHHLAWSLSRLRDTGCQLLGYALTFLGHHSGLAWGSKEAAISLQIVMNSALTCNRVERQWKSPIGYLGYVKRCSIPTIRTSHLDIFRCNAIKDYLLWQQWSNWSLWAARLKLITGISIPGSLFYKVRYATYCAYYCAHYYQTLNTHAPADFVLQKKGGGSLLATAMSLKVLE